MEKRWILVAGASRGIGFAATRLFLEEGYCVVASSRDTRALQEAFRDVSPDRIKIIPFDFTRIDELQDYASEVVTLSAGISGMLYAAGMQKTLPLSQCKPSLTEELFRLNTFAAFELIRLFSKKNAYSSVGASFVLISSLAAHEGALGKALYGASKGALEGFLPAAAAELAPKRIRLNAVTLGIIRTDMSGEFIRRMGEEQKTALLASYPLGLGEPEDAAAFIAYLISDKARWLTGQAFVLDGGHSVRGN